MSGIFSDANQRGRHWPHPDEVRPALSFLDADDGDPVLPREDSDRTIGARFDAELDVCELDERGRPGLTWPAQARELSRSRLAFRSRRMCYIGRRLLIAIHLIDDRPAALAGRVAHCSYDSDGMYRVELELTRLATRPDILAWINDRRPR
jgi:hypothetical protein